MAELETKRITVTKCVLCGVMLKDNDIVQWYGIADIVHADCAEPGWWFKEECYGL